MSNNHGDRGHAAWSASASARNWACAGALRLCATIPEQPESFPAAWGTACHQLSERCLRDHKDAAEFIGTEEKTKEHTIEVDEELAETAQVYIDYVNKVRQSARWVQLEEYFSLEKLNPPVEAGGTADCTAYFPDDKLLEVIDLKGGRGVRVDANENKQLRTYALGAMLAFPGLDVDRVKVTIVQPRIPHPDGKIRSETFHVADLIEWTEDLLAAMARSAAPDAQPVAGDHCSSTFCPAQAVCPALAAKSIEVMNAHFHPITDEIVLPSPEDLSLPDLVKMLDSADMVTSYFNAVRAYAHHQAESGVEIPNYVLVPKQARKKWLDGAEATLRTLVEAEDLYADPKLKTPMQVIKALGKNASAIKDLWSAESSGTNLVRSDKTTRKAVKPSVNQHFDVLE